MDQRDDGVTVTVTAGNGGAAPSPGAVMLVERGDGAAFLARLWPLVLALGVHGLAGEREAVRKTLVRLRGAVGERAGGLGVDDRAAEVIGGIDAALAAHCDAVTEAADDAGAARRGEVRRPGRKDVIVAMHRAGTLGDAELAAALELRHVEESLLRSYGVRAVDPGRPVVDGGEAPWCLPASSRTGYGTPAVARATIWAEYMAANSLPIVGKRGRMTVLELVAAVVVDNEPMREIERRLGVKNGRVSSQLTAALALYAAMNGGKPEPV